MRMQAAMQPWVVRNPPVLDRGIRPTHNLTHTLAAELATRTETPCCGPNGKRWVL
jgi:hypothetical protein